MSEIVVMTKNGPLRGNILRTIENYEYCAFKGIPYAKPPINELRFKEPEPMDNWSEVRDATKFGNQCLQYDSMLRTFAGSEDCLYLNVYAPPIENLEKLKPVMMFVQGGGYMVGSGSDLHYGPDYLVKKDIVMVTINYRLGIFGFLNLEDEICPGNNGLKDIIMALKWLHDNIQNFCGDPKNITAFGESAGGSIVNMLALSPISKGLIHKIISQSGTAASLWSNIKEPSKYAFQLCTSFGKYIFKPKQAFEFLKNIDADRLINAQEQLRRQMAESNKHQSINVPFGPSVDSKSPNPFMPIPIEEALLEGIDMPFLLGFNSNEGTYFLLDQFLGMPLKDSDYTVYDLSFNSCLHQKIKELLKRYNMTPNDLKQMYFNGKKFSKKEWQNLSNMQGDLYLHYGIFQTVEVQANCKKAQTYFYKFSFDQYQTLMKGVHKIKFSGATHFDEITYLFRSNLCEKLGYPALKESKDAYKTMERMTEMWTNFAKYGNPTPEITDLLPIKWEPVDNAVDMPYLNIDIELSMGTTRTVEEKFKNFKP